MPLPSSGPLSLNDIKGEFGGPASPSLGDYYAGGAYVPAGTTGTHGAVPSTGTISIRNFYGTSNVVISISNESIFALSFAPDDATAAYRLNSNGQVESLVNGSPTTLEQWCTPTSAAGNYEARVTVTSGALSSGTTGTWLALSTSRTWSVTQSGAGSSFCSFTVEIRRTGTTTVLDSALIDLVADVL
jgi:hypothetical protein